MKKTLSWFDTQGIVPVFHDYKKEGVPQPRLVRWCDVSGWQSLLNKRGTTWRKLTAEQQAITTQAQAVALMLAYPSVIRRPVIEVADALQIGFDPLALTALLDRASEPMA